MVKTDLSRCRVQFQIKRAINFKSQTTSAYIRLLYNIAGQGIDSTRIYNSGNRFWAVAAAANID